MAYINKNDFSIVSFIVDQYKDEYFECDDLIAPAISLLNKKGYKTMFCCSGHPYPYIWDELSVDHPVDEEGFKYLSVEDAENYKDIEEYEDEYKYYNIYKCDFANPLYVSFAKKHNFPELPEDAYSENGDSIYFNFISGHTNDFNDVTRVYERNKLFYEWVEKLEDINEE